MQVSNYMTPGDIMIQHANLQNTFQTTEATSNANLQDSLGFTKKEEFTADKKAVEFTRNNHDYTH